jgi:hypothetical protein
LGIGQSYRTEVRVVHPIRRVDVLHPARRTVQHHVDWRGADEGLGSRCAPSGDCGFGVRRVLVADSLFGLLSRSVHHVGGLHCDQFLPMSHHQQPAFLVGRIV